MSICYIRQDEVFKTDAQLVNDRLPMSTVNSAATLLDDLNYIRSAIQATQGADSTNWYSIPYNLTSLNQVSGTLANDFEVEHYSTRQGGGVPGQHKNIIATGTAQISGISTLIGGFKSPLALGNNIANTLSLAYNTGNINWKNGTKYGKLYFSASTYPTIQYGLDTSAEFRIERVDATNSTKQIIAKYAYNTITFTQDVHSFGAMQIHNDFRAQQIGSVQGYRVAQNTPIYLESDNGYSMGTVKVATNPSVFIESLGGDKYVKSGSNADLIKITTTVNTLPIYSTITHYAPTITQGGLYIETVAMDIKAAIIAAPSNIVTSSNTTFPQDTPPIGVSVTTPWFSVNPTISTTATNENNTAYTFSDGYYYP